MREMDRHIRFKNNQNDKIYDSQAMPIIIHACYIWCISLKKNVRSQIDS